LSSLDLIQVVFIGVGTGFGSALGTEIARYIVGVFKERKAEKENETEKEVG
jgi:hypothetical protein